MRRKIRVLIVLDNLNLGGAERQAFILSNHLNKQNDFEVFITALLPEGNLLNSNFDLSSFIKVQPFYDYPNLILKIFEMVRFSIRLRKLKPDVIITYTIRPNVAVNFAWQLTGAKCIFWNQRDEGFGFSNKRDILFNWAFTNTSFYIANSSSARNAIILRSPKVESKIHVITNGSVPQQPRYTNQYWKDQLRLDDRPACMMIANLTKRKDHETVIRSWNYLKYCIKPLILPVLILVGEKGDTFENLFKMIHEFELDNDVILSGFVEDISGIVSIADFGIHSSVSESQPNSIIEFMCYSKAVIASDIIAHRDVLGEDYPFFFPVKDHKKLAEMVVQVSELKDLRTSIEKANVKRFEQNLAVDKMVLSYQLLIRNCLNER